MNVASAMLVGALIDRPDDAACRRALIDCLMDEDGCSKALATDTAALVARIGLAAAGRPRPTRTGADPFAWRVGQTAAEVLARYRRVPNAVLAEVPGA